MEGITPVKLIAARWNTSKVYLEPWRKKIHAMRSAVAGDFSAIDPEAVSNQAEEPTPKKAARERRGDDFYDVLVRDFEVGINNELLRAIKTLHQQVTYRAPSFSFENISDLEASVCGMYLQKRMGARPFGCNSTLHYKKSVLDYLICGAMATMETIDNGKAEVKYVDLLDILFDPDASVITESKWIGMEKVESISTWLEIYPDNPWLRTKAEELSEGNVDGEEWLDTPVEVAYYWDTTSNTGTMLAAIMINGQISTDDPDLILEATINPHFVAFDGYREAFIPITVSTYLELPNVTAATGQAELIMASQVAIHRAERKIQERFENARTFYEVKRGDMDEDEIVKFNDRDQDGSIIQTKSGDGIRLRDISEIPASDIAYIQYHKQALEELSGANPYASGGKKDGIKFAAEVNAIQGSSSLTSSSISADIARHIEISAWKMLCNGANYDDQPIQLTYNSLQLEFGPNDPIGMYLRPDATPQVSEDDLRFLSRQDREAIASNRLQIAMNYQAIAPASAAIQYRRYLEATGERDVDSHFVMPQMPMMGGDANPESDTTEKVA
jgi:hypothetical protein